MMLWNSKWVQGVKGLKFGANFDEDDDEKEDEDEDVWVI